MDGHACGYGYCWTDTYHSKYHNTEVTVKDNPEIKVVVELKPTSISSGPEPVETRRIVFVTLTQFHKWTPPAGWVVENIMIGSQL